MAQQNDPYLCQIRETVADLLSLIPHRPFAVRLPNGTLIESEPEEQTPQFTLVLKRPSVLRRMFLPPSELAMGEAYLFDGFNIEGDIEAAFGFIAQLEWRRPSWRKLLRLGWQLWRLELEDRDMFATRQQKRKDFSGYAHSGQLHSVNRDKRAVQFHYDLSNAFYQLWLDQRLVYSCAYFPDGDETLDLAQVRKLDLLCRKLNLQPGERLLDIGCGWGGFVIHATAEYGARATGITLSEAQAKEALARIQALDLADRCEVSICHYHQFEAGAPFDKLVSIGMFEHVGMEKLPGYFARAYQILQPGGLFLLQGGTARLDRRHVGKGWMDRMGFGRIAFMQKYSFPDSHLIDVPTVLVMAEQAGFETLEVTSMRLHAIQTVRHWLTRLEQNRELAVAEVGETAYRCWLLTWAGLLHLLHQGQLSEYQFIFAKPANSDLSLRVGES